MFRFLGLIGLTLLSLACASTVSVELEPLFETPDFSLQDCSGSTISKEDLAGSIWVVDFIFTRCGGPCPLMTQRMRSLQKSLARQGLLSAPSPVKLVSISVDPAYDTPEVLKEYGESWEVDLNSWLFLTGPPERTLELIRDGFKIAATGQGASSSNQMPSIIHSTNFLLVDQRGWVRSIFHLDDPRLKEDIIEGIMALLN